MNFKQAMLTAADPAKLKGKDKSIAMKLASDNKHPLLWKALEKVVTHRYERDTGEKVGAGFDWSTILTWLVENLPSILKLIMAIFAL